MALYIAFVNTMHALFEGGAASNPPVPAAQPTWVEVFGYASAVIASIGVVIVAIVKIAKLARGVGHFLDDWNGEEARPGVDGRPGVLARLAAVEHRTEQLTPNGGKHIADAVARMEAQLVSRAGMPQVLERIGIRLDRIEHQLCIPGDESLN